MKKELTIYDVQVNCARLSKEKIENLARIVKENGGKISSLDKNPKKSYFRFDYVGFYGVVVGAKDTKQLISYDRFVELFDKKELEVGKWYKDSTKTQFVFRQNDHNNSGVIDSEWKDELFSCSNRSEWSLATEQEISTLLIAEAKKRGYENMELESNEYRFNAQENTLDIAGVEIFNNGKWAELLEEEPKEQEQSDMEKTIKALSEPNPDEPNKDVELGKWYVAPFGKMLIFKANKGKDLNNYGLSDIYWREDMFCYDNEFYKPATKEHIEYLLSEEAERRGFREGARIVGNCGMFKAVNGYFKFDMEENTLSFAGAIIFNKGKWLRVLVEEINEVTDKLDSKTLEYQNPDIKELCKGLEIVESNVNSTSKPTHYKTKSGYDVINITQDNGLNFSQGAIIKYVIRAGKKLYPNMNERESYLADLKKAQDHINREIEFVKSKLK